MAEITASMVKELREKSGAGMMDCKKALTESGGDFQKAMNLLRERGAAIASKRSSRAAKEGLITAFVTADHRTGALVELNCESDFVARNEDFKDLAARLARHAATDAPAGADLNQTQFEGQTVEETIKQSIGKIGENIVLSRSVRLDSTDGLVVSYIHPPGRIGVLVEIGGARPELAQDASFQEFARGIAMHVAAAAPVCTTRDEVPAELLENEKEVYRKQALNEGKPEQIVDKIVQGRISKYYSEVCLLEQPYVQDPDKKVEQVVKEAAGKFGAVTVKRFVRYQLGETAKAAEGAEE